MGNNCGGCGKYLDTDNVNLEEAGGLGYDDEGVTEDFQYHEAKLEKNEIKLSMHDKMLRMATQPMFLIQVEDLWAEVENLSQKCNLSPKESILKYSEFLEHFKLGSIQAAMLDPDSLFVKMLELEGVFIKPEDMFSMDISTLSGEKTKTVSPDAGFDIFKFKILALLVCRGSPKVKAGLLFDLVYRGKEIPEKVIIWSNSKLKSAFEQLFFFSEVMPKIFYLQSQGENVIKEKIQVELGKLASRNY